MCSSTGAPATGRRGLGVVSVNGRSRLPLPASNKTTFTTIQVPVEWSGWLGKRARSAPAPENVSLRIAETEAWRRRLVKLRCAGRVFVSGLPMSQAGRPLIAHTKPPRAAGPRPGPDPTMSYGCHKAIRLHPCDVPISTAGENHTGWPLPRARHWVATAYAASKVKGSPPALPRRCLAYNEIVSFGVV